jgi:hAT family C-terminal dimerisation region
MEWMSFSSSRSSPIFLYVYAIERWRTIGCKKFSFLSLLARDRATLICMVSSVPSKPFFSDSGGIVTGYRARLSDENIEMLMKLRSWNRLFRDMKKN